MPNVKRFNVVTITDFRGVHTNVLKEHPKGQFVPYSEYQKIIEQVDRIKETVKEAMFYGPDDLVYEILQNARAKCENIGGDL